MFKLTPQKRRPFDGLLIQAIFCILLAQIMACNNHSNQGTVHQNLSRAVCLSVSPTTETIVSTPCDGFEQVFSSILQKRELSDADTLRLLGERISNLKFDTANKELDIRGKFYLYSNSDTTVVCFDPFGNVAVNGKLINAQKGLYKFLTKIAGWNEYPDSLKK